MVGMKHGTQSIPGEGALVDSDQRCTCNPDDVGMGHNSDCWVGERNNIRTARYAYDLLAVRVPLALLKPLADWLVQRERVFGIKTGSGEQK